jgi:integrase
LDAITDCPTSQQVEAYRQNVLRGRGKDEISVAAGRRYVNSMLRQVKAFTSSVWQERSGIKLGAGAVAIREARKFGRVPTPQFRYSPELLERTLKWADGLRQMNVDAYRIFWFAIGNGARRSEIAKLKWEHFVTDVDPVVVQGDFLTKDGSLACLQFVYGEAWVKWCAVPADAAEGWVFGGPDSRRAERAFRFLCDRMRGLGWTGRFKLHELRAAVITKAFETHGMGAAQMIARHKNASTTDKYIRAKIGPVGRIEF